VTIRLTSHHTICLQAQAELIRQAQEEAERQAYEEQLAEEMYYMQQQLVCKSWYKNHSTQGFLLRWFSPPGLLSRRLVSDFHLPWFFTLRLESPI